MNNRSQHRKGRRLLAVLASPGLIACLCISALTHGVSLAAADDSAKPADSEVPQASYAGQDACLECHDDVGESFSEAVHGRVELPGWAGNDGCESCHGPLAVPAETGEPDDVTSFAEMSAVDANEACLTCHGSNAGMYWRGSRHETVDVRCTQCHAVHGSWTLDKALANRNVTENCLTCHTEQQKSMFQRSNHPLRNGQMSCA
ncbi:MAG: cytochrome c3 family protein, partial [Acidobacteriota bacterium]